MRITEEQLSKLYGNQYVIYHENSREMVRVNWHGDMTPDIILIFPREMERMGLVNLCGTPSNQISEERRREMEENGMCRATVSAPNYMWGNYDHNTNTFFPTISHPTHMLFVHTYEFQVIPDEDEDLSEWFSASSSGEVPAELEITKYRTDRSGAVSYILIPSKVFANTKS